MKREYESLKEYSFIVLFSAAVRKLVEYKAVREVICGAAVLLSLVCMDKVKQVQSEIWWIYGPVNLPFFTMYAAGIAGLVSSFVRFGKRGFAVTAVAAGVLLWVYKSFVVCFGYLFPGTETAVVVE